MIDTCRLACVRADAPASPDAQHAKGTAQLGPNSGCQLTTVHRNHETMAQPAWPESACYPAIQPGPFDANSATGWWSPAATGHVFMVPCTPGSALVTPPPGHFQSPYNGHYVACDIRIGYVPSAGQAVIYQSEPLVYPGPTPPPSRGADPSPHHGPHYGGASSSSGGRNVHEHGEHYGAAPQPSHALGPPLNSRPFAATRSGRPVRSYRRTDNATGSFRDSTPSRPQTASGTPLSPGSCPGSQDNFSSELSCSVCLESYVVLQRQNKRAVVLTSCCHVFCQRCIEAVMSTRNKCPKCRQAIDSTMPYRLLFF